MTTKLWFNFLFTLLIFSSCTGENKPELNRTMPKSGLVQDENGHFVAASRDTSDPKVLHIEHRVPAGDSVNWFKHLPIASQQGNCQTCFIFASTEYLESIQNKALDLTPKRHDVTPMVIVKTAQSFAPMLDPSYSNYIANKIKLSKRGKLESLKDASCVYGGSFGQYLKASEYVQEKNAKHTLCPVSFARQYRTSDTREVVYPLECTGDNCKPRSELDFCEASSDNPDLFAPYKQLKAKNSKLDLDSLTRIIPTPFWKSHVVHLEKSPLYFEIYAEDAAGIITYSKSSNRYRFTDMDSGNHVACLNQSSGVCLPENQIYFFGDTDHAVLLAKSRETASGTNIIVRNSWGKDWGKRGNFEAVMQEPFACNTDSECTRQFGAQLKAKDWARHGWTVKCNGSFKYRAKEESDFSTKQYCTAALLDTATPDMCDQKTLKCPSKEQVEAGGRCTHYFLEEKDGVYFPIGKGGSYCLPSMHELGVTAVTGGTLFWDNE